MRAEPGLLGTEPTLDTYQSAQQCCRSDTEKKFKREHRFSVFRHKGTYYFGTATLHTSLSDFAYIIFYCGLT